MTSTLITSQELQDLEVQQLRSKFYEVSRDVERLRAQSNMLFLAEASLQNISRELTLKRIRSPKP